MNRSFISSNFILFLIFVVAAAIDARIFHESTQSDQVGGFPCYNVVHTSFSLFFEVLVVVYCLKCHCTVQRILVA